MWTWWFHVEIFMVFLVVGVVQDRFYYLQCMLACFENEEVCNFYRIRIKHGIRKMKGISEYLNARKLQMYMLRAMIC